MGLLLSCALKLYVLMLSCLVIVARRSAAGVASPQFDSIYQFGDSLSDTGNGLRENATSGLCSAFPYGESFFGYVTGRCSDGLVMADYYARAFGLPFLNPYLDSDANFSNGADFSVAGASALNVDFLESKGIIAEGRTNSSLALQLGWFKSLLKSICSSPQECENKLGRSLFLMEAIGGNDYNYAFGDDKSFEVVYDLVPYVVQAITNGVKEMILLGATYVVVPGIVPFGCMPNYLATVNSTDPSMYDEIGCLKGLNEFSEFHNERVQNATKELQILYPNATIIYADYYTAIRWVLENAASLGFDKDKLLTACCGEGKNPYNYEASEMCGTLGVPVCPNPKERVHWDGEHFTQQLYEYVSGWMLNHTIIPHLAYASVPLVDSI